MVGSPTPRSPGGAPRRRIATAEGPVAASTVPLVRAAPGIHGASTSRPRGRGTNHLGSDDARDAARRARPPAARRGRARARAGARAAPACACTPAASAAPTCTSVDGEIERRAPAARARPPDRRPRRAESGRRVGVPWLGVDRGDVRVLPRGPREPLRRGRASPAATSTAASPSTPSPTSGSASRSRTASRRPGRAAAVRRADRLPRLRFAGDAERLGLYGFGASAHILCQVARPPGPAGVRVHAPRGRRGARRFAPRARRRVGRRQPRARRPSRSTRRSSSPPPARSSRRAAGGRAGRDRRVRGIHMSDIPCFPYADLWHERVLRSVANLTRARRRGVPRAGAAGPGAHRPCSDLPARGRARRRSTRLRAGRIEGAAVLEIVAA